MSWYTIIFPDKCDYSSEHFGTIDAINENIECLKVKKDEAWRRISSCVFMTPYSEEGKDVVETMDNLFTKYWDEYISLSEDENALYFAKEVQDDQERHTKDVLEGRSYEDEMADFTDENGNVTREWRPSYSYNHYEYNHLPSEGVTETKKVINDIRNKLTSLACATPKDIVRADNEEDVFYTIGQMLNEYKEILDETLFTNFFSRMCVKYWDNHVEG